jgi:hypothetical protein
LQYNQQGQRPGAGATPRQREAVEKLVEVPKEDESGKDAPVEPGKTAKVTYFNCVEWGHFNNDCKKPRLCFICQTTDHVGRDCPEWLKHVELAQYLGSAAQGLGFFHVNVAEEKNRRGYLKFLDNCAILTVEEGLIDEENIVENLKRIFFIIIGIGN